MMRFDALPILMQNLTCFWALTICFLCIADVILLWRQKRYAIALAAAFHFLAAYFVLHLCRELTERRLYGNIAPVAARLTKAPYFVCLAVLLGLSVGGAFLFRTTRTWRKAHITPSSIRESMDGLPAGICYYLEEGRCILVNHRMNKICLTMTGRNLQDGAAFYAIIKGKPVHVLPDGTAIAFRHRAITYEHAPLYELIADDVSELYRKTEQLRQDNERARKLSEGMKAYGETIADTVRRQEILEAKIHIHDEMNRMLLATQKAVQDGTGETDRADILRMWRSQTQLLRNEAGSSTDSNLVSDLNALASVIGIEIVWNGTPDAGDTPSLKLFLLAAREAMANAAKHAGAKHLHIDLKYRRDALTAVFSNDGKAPDGSIQETGGLANLRERIEESGGSMQLEWTPDFRLTIRIPTGGNNNVLQSSNRGRPGNAKAAF
jgi:signal transduction histidine kinase